MNIKGNASIVFRTEPTREEIKSAENALLNISSELSVLRVGESSDVFNEFGIYFSILADADEETVYKDLVSILHVCSDFNCRIAGYVLFCDEEKFELTKFQQNEYHIDSFCCSMFAENFTPLDMKKAWTRWRKENA